MQATYNFTGIDITATNLGEVAEHLKAYHYNKAAHIAFPDASVLAMAQEDDGLKAILNSTWLTLPDGKPQEIVGRRLGHKNVKTVSGYWLCQTLLESELTHYFYGSTPEVLASIEKEVKEKFPNAKVLGYKSPPFVATGDLKDNEDIISDFNEINALKPNLLWIGLSSPKQDYLIHHHLHRLDSSLCLGVGGVFDYLSGRVEKSPEWVKKVGLRWFWRLASEPKRLWRKYLLVFRYVALPFIKVMVFKK